MERSLAFLFGLAICAPAVAAIPVMRPANYVNPEAYAYMYPYLNNQMRTELNPGTTVSQTNNPIDIVVKTKRLSEPRNVVPRPRASNARAATVATAMGGAVASAANRRVVARTNSARSGTVQTANTAKRGVVSRGVVARVADVVNTTNTDSGGVSNSRCLADYINCMDGYCKREEAAYNRCYCSAKLAQIDAQYQPEISALITQIINLRGGGTWTDEEMNEYWMERIGNYAGENSWARLDAALNIEWPTSDERTRGQNAFLTGHNYCVQHLRACSYMASNMRDAYRSQVSRDCGVYENSLIKIKNAAESVIEYFNE